MNNIILGEELEKKYEDFFGVKIKTDCPRTVQNSILAKKLYEAYLLIVSDYKDEEIPFLHNPVMNKIAIISIQLTNMSLTYEFLANNNIHIKNEFVKHEEQALSLFSTINSNFTKMKVEVKQNGWIKLIFSIYSLKEKVNEFVYFGNYGYKLPIENTDKIIITGIVGSGKTTLALDLAVKLHRLNKKVVYIGEKNEMFEKKQAFRKINSSDLINFNSPTLYFENLLMIDEVQSQYLDPNKKRNEILYLFIDVDIEVPKSIQLELISSNIKLIQIRSKGRYLHDTYKLGKNNNLDSGLVFSIEKGRTIDQYVKYLVNNNIYVDPIFYNIKFIDNRETEFIFVIKNERITQIIPL